MRAPMSRPWPALVAALVVLLLGAGVAIGVGDALGLSHSPAATPAPVPAAGAVAAMAPAPRIERVEVPAGERIGLAADAVADALTARGQAAPAVATRLPGADLSVRIVAPFAAS